MYRAGRSRQLMAGTSNDCSQGSRRKAKQVVRDEEGGLIWFKDNYCEQ